MNKLLYIGSELDIDIILNIFVDANQFIIVDSLPRTKLKNLSENELLNEKKFNANTFEKQYVNKLVKKIKNLGYMYIEPIELEPNYFTKILSPWQRIKWVGKIKQLFPYINPNQITFYKPFPLISINYYVSTNILYNLNDTLQENIKTCSGLIISEYLPSAKILDYFTNKINLYFSSDIKLNPTYDSLDNIIVWLFENLNSGNCQKINKMYIFDKKTHHIVQFNDLFKLCELTNNTHILYKNNENLNTIDSELITIQIESID